MTAATLRNYEKYKDLELIDRNFSTKVNCKIDPKSIDTLNEVIFEFQNTLSRLSFWELNVVHYASAIILIQRHGKLNERKPVIKPVKRGWETELGNQINAIRRKMSHVTLIMNFPSDHILNKKQKAIAVKVKKYCGNLEHDSLISKLTLLNHELKVRNTKLKDMRIKAERSRINHQFVNNQKQVYRQWKSRQVEITTTPPIDDVKTFWADIWEKEVNVNIETDWYKQLQSTYCSDVTTKKYEINRDIFDKVISRLPNNKAPGRDAITGFWIKKISAVHLDLINIYREVKNGSIAMPQWLITSKTNLIPKNADTHLVKNYRPIACQNTTYKLYTGIINQFIEDHCLSNDIITLEQAGGKKGSWGCTDQLLINKMVLDEVRKSRRNIFTMCFDYRKAFDSIPHIWLFESLRLAKLPEEIIKAVQSLGEKWATEIYIQTKEIVSVTDVIRYLTAILQGDCLSLLLFVLCINHYHICSMIAPDI